VASLHEVVRRLGGEGVPFRILGGGTNVLVADGPLREAVVSTMRLRGIRWGGGKAPEVRVEAGVYLQGLVELAARRGLGGLEVLGGIPGTVGGAVFGNAGGRHGCIGDLVERVRVADRDGVLRWLDRDAIRPRYRETDLEGRVVLEIVLRVTASGPARVRPRLEAILRERRGLQPGCNGSMGCFFKNPAERGPAGMLIDRAGCKGARVGDVWVSRRHANFLVNGGRGTASDFLTLARRVRAAVARRFAVRLQPEVRIWGNRAIAG